MRALPEVQLKSCGKCDYGNKCTCFDICNERFENEVDELILENPSKTLPLCVA